MFETVKRRITDKKWIYEGEGCYIRFTKDIKQIEIRAVYGCTRQSIRQVLKDSNISYPYYKFGWDVTLRTSIDLLIYILLQLNEMEVIL
jgi:hypothetical protein